MSTNAMPFQPTPGTQSAISARIFVNEIRYEFLKMLRTRTLLPFSPRLPHHVLPAVWRLQPHNDFARYLMASYSCMGVVSACLFGIGMGISMERAQGWLELKLASPMPRLAYLVAKIVSSMAFATHHRGCAGTLAVTIGGTHVTAPEVLRLTGIGRRRLTALRGHGPARWP